jgi:serine/tyrosine/threonine adenylyltransferase
MIDDIREIKIENTYAGLGEGFFTDARPTPLSNPYLVAFNPDVGRMLNLAPSVAEQPEFLACFSGNLPLPGSKPVAMRYTGHQFGQYNPDIGDGRAILLGEVRAVDGALRDLHLKGAGQTAYARGFDGRAVLRSTIREYLCGEAMHGLGIPTTRSLCIAGSDDPVHRETVETAAMLVRVARSHVRFGSFEPLYDTGQTEQIRRLADYVIQRNYPEIPENDEDRHILWFRETVRRTARLIAGWQAVGFTHGVMNTDNMSIAGLTLDYGPYAFMEAYHPGFIPNHSDRTGRYAFNRQPPVALWNLQVLGKALSPVLRPEKAAEILDSFIPAFETEYLDRMRKKLGLRKKMEQDAEIIRELLGILAGRSLDYTIFFRSLSDFTTRAGSARPDHPVNRFPEFTRWRQTYRERLKAESSVDAFRKSAMDRVNPKYILRTYMARIAIRKATEARDYSEIERLRKLFASPFEDHPEMAEYAGEPPAWSRDIVLSCSS